MSQKSSLTQSAHSVRQVLTGYTQQPPTLSVHLAVYPDEGTPSSPTHKLLKLLERVKGIEPSSSAWKAVALPLSYTR